MIVNVRFFVGDDYNTFDYKVNSPDKTDVLNSVTPQLLDHCASHGIDHNDISAFSIHIG